MSDFSQAAVSPVPGQRIADSERGLLLAIVAFAAVVPAVLLMAPAVAGQLALQFGWGPVAIGNLFAAELGAMSLASLPAWYWLPRSHWQRATLVAGLGFIAANLASLMVASYTGLLVCRFLSALAGGSLMVLCMSAAAQTRNPDRVYSLWVMGQLVLGALGLILLPALSARYGIAACYAGLAGLMVLCLPLARYLPTGASPQRLSQPQATPEVGGDRRWQVLGCAAVLSFYISLSGVWTFAGGLASQAGIDAQQSGNILAMATLLGVVGAVCAALLGQRIRRVHVLLAGYLMMMAAILLLLWQPAMPRFTVATFLFKFAWTFVLPFILASLAHLDRGGRMMSAINLVIGAGLAIGPAVAGQIIAANGGSFQLLLQLAVAMAAVSLGMMLWLQRRTRV